MAGDGGGSGEHRRHATSLPREVRVADAIHALMYPVEAPHAIRLRSGTPRVTELRQLPRRHHSVLPSRKLGQPFMPNPLTFVAHRATKVRGLLDSPPPRVQVGGARCRNGGRTALRGPSQPPWSS